jgi:hypothetical protein
MITETIFLAETFYAHSVISFRQEKSFQDLFWPAMRQRVRQSQAASQVTELTASPHSVPSKRR